MGKHDMTMPSSGVPAARKMADISKAISKLIAECDQLAEKEERLQNLRRELSKRGPGAPIDLDIADAELDDDTRVLIKRCQEGIKKFERPEYFENDNDDYEEQVLRQEIIAERLTLMFGCVDIGPTSTEPEAFTAMMLMHVYEANVVYLAPLSGCKAVEKANKPVRSIGYVLEILQQHDEEWRDRRWMINNGIFIVAGLLRKEILKAKQNLQHEQAKVAVRKADHMFSQARIGAELAREREQAAIDLIAKTERDYQAAVENRDEAVAAREAAERKIPDCEIALQSAQAALAKLEAEHVPVED